MPTSASNVATESASSRGDTASPCSAAASSIRSRSRIPLCNRHIGKLKASDQSIGSWASRNNPSPATNT
ncbi:Uncharacterised protein [Mycobacteroides abscessus subsp. abscessus]|nr:Uncharacterised protein [Mycobacteroides abscessus subsp. abscessus]